jgi:hypothetical protein
MFLSTPKRLVRATPAVEKIKELLPVPMVVYYTGLNAIIAGATATTISDEVKPIVRLIIFAVAVVVTIIYLIGENRKATAKDKKPVVQLVFTVITFAIWTATLGQILELYIPGWNLTYSNLLVAAWTGAVPHILNLFLPE